MTNPPPQRTRRTRRNTPAWYKKGLASVSTVSSVVAIYLVSIAALSSVQAQEEAVRLLSEYVRIDTSNPPGDTRKAADFLAAILEREGIPVTRYESAPGKAIIYARLKATVLPAAGKAILLMHQRPIRSSRQSAATSCGPAARWT